MTVDRPLTPPRLLGLRSMYSSKWIDTHFWLHTFGLVLYIASMWIAGVMQGLMWRAVNEDGTLTYSFVESVKATFPYYVIRMTGGLMYFSGMLVMAYNVAKTMMLARPANNAIPVLASTASHVPANAVHA